MHDQLILMCHVAKKDLELTWQRLNQTIMDSTINDEQLRVARLALTGINGAETNIANLIRHLKENPTYKKV